MNRFSKLAALAVALPLAVALTACTGGASGSTPAPAESSAAAPAGNKLTVWAWDPAFNIYAMNEAAKVYQKDHPDFTLEVVETPWDDLQTKIVTLAGSGQTQELPDIFLMQNNAFQKNLANYPEVFKDLTDSGVDYSLFPAGVTAYSTGADGKNYGVPFDNGTAIHALRTDVLKEAGYTAADFTDLTWSEYITKAKDVLKKTKKPLLSDLTGQADLIMMMLQSAGASIFDDAGKPAIANNAALLKAIETYQDLIKSGVLVQVNSWDEYIGSFVNSNVGGLMNGVWIMGSIQTAADQSGKWTVTNMPKLDDVAGATNFASNGGSSWAVTTGADYALASDFLKSTFAGSTEFYDTILPKSGAVANWLPAGKSEVYNKPLEFFSNEPVFAKVLEFSAQVPKNNTGAYYYEGRDAVNAAVAKILNGSDPAVALAEAQKNVEFAMK